MFSRQYLGVPSSPPNVGPAIWMSTRSSPTVVVGIRGKGEDVFWCDLQFGCQRIPLFALEPIECGMCLEILEQVSAMLVGGEELG